MTCVWEADPACLGDRWESLDGEQKQRALMLATSSLQALTYYRVGTCPITIRPVPDRPSCGCSFHPHMESDGRWYNHCAHRGPIRPLGEIDIPGPVGYIDEFLIDGQPVDFSDGNWRLDDGHLLVWQGEGTCPIPARQDLNKPDTEPGTYSITYSQSYPVGEDGQIAVALLALEFAEACKPKGKCSLPRGVTNVVRNGVTFTVDAGLFVNGLTGIQVVDAFITKWAPVGSPSRNAVIFDPSKAAPRRTTSVPVRVIDSI